MIRKLFNIFAYTALFLFALLCLLFFHSYFFLIMTVMLVLMPIVSIIAVRFLREHITISFDGVRESIHVGDPFVIRMRVQNGSFLPAMNCYVNLKVSNKLMGLEKVHKINMPVRARGWQEYEFSLQSSYVGAWTFETESCLIEDWLGVVGFSCDSKAKKDVVVLPLEKPFEVPDINSVLDGMNELEESNKKGYDYAEFNGIREYQPGDKLQNIHWKLSAKKEELMVKERIALASGQLVILTDLFHGPQDILQEILTKTFGVGLYLLEKQIPFSYMWWSEGEKELRTASVADKDELEVLTESLFYEYLPDDAGVGLSVAKQIMNEGTNLLVIDSNDIYQIAL